MMDLLWIILCVFLGAPMIFSPGKILERPACKIKSKAMIRACGVLIIVIAVIQAFI